MEYHKGEKTITTEQLVEKLPPSTILIFLGLIVILGIVLGGAITFGISKIYGSPLTEVMESLSQENNLSKRQFVRFALVINHLFLFLLPSLVLSYLLFKKHWHKFLNLSKIGSTKFIANITSGTFLILASLPFIQYVFYLNKNYLPLPEWARNIEDNTNAMIGNLLVVDVSWELWFNLIVIAVIPALGEEFLFRGILQKQLGRLFKRADIAIWAAAAIFSLTHFQLEGFFPRLILGAVLGYLFYWTRTLWIPIIIHFIYNAMQVLTVYLMPEKIKAIDSTTEVPIPIAIAIFSLGIALSVAIFIRNYNKKIEIIK